MSDREREEERRVADVAAGQGWDTAPYTVALEIKRLLTPVIDAETSIDSGTGLLWPPGASGPIEGQGFADLHFRVGGVEFSASVQRSISQLLRDGVSRAALGLPDEPEDGGPAIATPRE